MFFFLPRSALSVLFCDDGDVENNDCAGQQARILGSQRQIGPKGKGQRRQGDLAARRKQGLSSVEFVTWELAHVLINTLSAKRCLLPLSD